MAGQAYVDLDDPEDQPAGSARRGSEDVVDSPTESASHIADWTTMASTPTPKRSISRTMFYALIAVCLMSVGSHFGMYLLGPLKSRLHREMGTSNSQFSLLIASFNLNSTWTPLVAGLLVARFGTAQSSIATTACVLSGQLILFWGVYTSHLIIMTLGLFIFGLGVTPLSVVQETLVSHLSPSRHLGLSLALGLVSGKSSAFIASLVSLPLANQYGDLMPFGIAVFLCTLSFVGNLLRLGWRWGQSPQEGEAKVQDKRKVQWGGMSGLGDVFWVYVLLNVLSGAIWQPFLHLSANLLQVRYSSSEAVASREASVLLAGAIILYPIVGYMTDRFSPSTPATTFFLIHLSSALTLLAYTYLLLPPSVTHSPWPAMFLFTTGHGMATLLMVILVPRLLPAHLIPLGLGLHKSMEMASSSLSQTLSGMWLDWTRRTADDDSDEYDAGEGLLRIFWIINVLQLASIFCLWRLEGRRRRSRVEVAVEEYERVPMSDVSDELDAEAEGEEGEVGGGGSVGGNVVHGHGTEKPVVENHSAIATSDAERQRGRIGFLASLGFIGIVWVVFLFTAWTKL